MHKLGLKLWSVNTDYYYEEAKRLYLDKVFDYIELYVVPDSLDTVEKWKSLKIPYIIHAPHFRHGVNLAVAERFQYNSKVFKEVEIFRQELNAEFIIVHSGIEGNIEEVVKQLNIIKPVDFVIENKPYRVPLDLEKLCRGYSIEEISKVINETGCGFCLDIGHAICAANSINTEPYSYLEDFNNLSPVIYHISGNYIDSTIDRHLHLNEGDYDLKRIFSIIKNDAFISIETNKDSKESLEDFKCDIEILKKEIYGN